MASPFVLKIASYIAVLAGMLWVERLAPFAGQTQEKGVRIRFHLGLGLANGLVLYLLVLWPTLLSLAWAQQHHFGLARLIGLQGWREISVSILVLDLFAYWVHRARHRIGFLWRFHRSHHSDTEVDVTTASRFHVGDLVISGLFSCLAIILWGPSLWAFAAHEMVSAAFRQFAHGNIRLPAKLLHELEDALVTPRMHRWHHALNRDGGADNFATIFCSWDRVFGTYRLAEEPAGEGFARAGLKTPRGEETMRVGAFLLAPFRNGR